MTELFVRRSLCRLGKGNRGNDLVGSQVRREEIDKEIVGGNRAAARASRDLNRSVEGQEECRKISGRIGVREGPTDCASGLHHRIANVVGGVRQDRQHRAQLG
jgi:hypothetical protein